MRPRIFIGSSREGHGAAEYVKNKLSTFADCQLWDEDFFEANNSTFESLSQSSVLFDFAILVASADDVQLRRDTLETIARDNVIFEFGLYVGRLGRRRAYMIKEKNLDLPSDLYGITLPTYKTDAADTGSTLDEVCDSILRQMQGVWNTYELSFVPSTVLAVGYYENFVLPVSKALGESANLKVNEKQYEDFVLNIAVPSQLPDSYMDHLRIYLRDSKLDLMEVKSDTRPYNFYLDYTVASGTTIELYDPPTTLSALKRAIEMAIPSGVVGETEQEAILKRKELNNFRRTLEYLISRNPYTKDKVKIKEIPVS